MLIQDFWVSCYQDSLFLNMWVPWSKSSLIGLGMFFEYSLPNSILETSFLFSLELFVCISGYGIIINPNKHIEKNEFSALTVAMNICSIFLLMAYGMGYTVSAFVGKYQATTKTIIAKKYMMMTLLQFFLHLSIVTVFFNCYSHKILSQYLNSEETISKITTRLPYFSAFVFLLSYYSVLNGVIKGLGLQSKAVVLTIICLYLISLPFAYVFGFMPELIPVSWDLKGFKGLAGLFTGFSVGLVVLNIGYVYLIWSLDWKNNSHQLLHEMNATK